MEKITLIGRLGRDASVKESQQGTRFLTFTMACDAFVRGEKRTHWYDVTSFDPNRYKNMLKYLEKGSSVTVVGDLDADIEEGRDGVTRIRRRVSADSIQFTPSSASGQTSEGRTTAKRVIEDPEDIDEAEITTKRSRRQAEPAEYSEEEEKPRRRRTAELDEEDEPEAKPHKRKVEEDEEEAPKPRKRKVTEPEDDEEEEKPRKRNVAAPVEDDEPEDDLPF